MDWAEDLKISIRKTTAKMGRRAGQRNLSSQTSSEREESLDIDFDPSSEGGTGSTDSTLKSPPKSKKSGGWAEAGPKSGKNRMNKNLIEEERFNSTTNLNDDFLDDIPIIPDLDDLQDELMMSTVVEPPSVSANRTVTLKELNSDLLKQSAFSTLEDIDLSILTKCLQSQANLDEPDEPWEWEKLFTEISADIHLDNNKVGKKDSTGDIQTPFLA